MQKRLLIVAVIIALCSFWRPDALAASPLKIVALGDSLTAGYGISPDAAFPARLQRALTARGIVVDITNAGIPGDTALGGLARLQWSVPEGTDGVILELGGNDGWFGGDPSETKSALDQIIRRLKARNISVLLCGIKAPRHHGTDYVRAFDGLFPQLASTHNLLFYPFFLDGVVYHPKRAQTDGIHPTESGIDYIVGRILPTVEQFIDQIRQRPRTQPAAKPEQYLGWQILQKNADVPNVQ